MRRHSAAGIDRGVADGFGLRARAGNNDLALRRAARPGMLCFFAIP